MEEKRPIPNIREGKEVKADEPKVTVGGKVAAMPHPVPAPVES